MNIHNSQRIRVDSHIGLVGLTLGFASSVCAPFISSWSYRDPLTPKRAHMIESDSSPSRSWLKISLKQYQDHILVCDVCSFWWHSTRFSFFRWWPPLKNNRSPWRLNAEAGYIATVMRSRNAHRFAGKSNSSSANSFVDPPFEFWALGQWELYRPYIWYRRHRYLQFRFLKWTLIRVEVNLDQIVVLPHCQMVHFLMSALATGGFVAAVASGEQGFGHGPLDSRNTNPEWIRCHETLGNPWSTWRFLLREEVIDGLFSSKPWSWLPQAIWRFNFPSAPHSFWYFLYWQSGSAQVQKGLDDYLATKFQTQRQIFWRFSEVDLIQWRLIFSKGIMTPKGPSC